MRVASSTHGGVRAANTTNPGEFIQKMRKQFGAFPILLTSTDKAAVTTLKNGASAATPFQNVLDALNAGERVEIEAMLGDAGS